MTHIPSYHILKWTGGKTALTPTIVPILNETKHKTYVEPFAGSAKIFFAKDPVSNEVLNDVNTNLIEFYQKVQNAKETPNCINFGSKAEFLKNKKKVESGNWEICDFVNLNKSSFGGSLESFQYPCPRHNDPKTNNGQCALVHFPEAFEHSHQRLQNVKLHNQSYIDMIQKYDSPQTLFYADPPYVGKTSKVYNTNLTEVTPDKIAESFSHIKGKVLISFNDSPDVRKEFLQRGFYIQPVNVKYRMGTKSNKQSKGELLITNDPKLFKTIQKHTS